MRMGDATRSLQNTIPNVRISTPLFATLEQAEAETCRHNSGLHQGRGGAYGGVDLYSRVCVVGVIR